MNTQSKLFPLALRAVQKTAKMLFTDPNVVGVGVGPNVVDGCETDDPALIISVIKRPERSASFTSHIPALISVGPNEAIPTVVQETGVIVQHSNTGRIRPARPGASIGNVMITAGTFGGVVVNDQSGKQVILSNNHVLAANNQAAIGSDIVQPGPFDGGRAPGDVIAHLTRYIPIVLEGNGDNEVDAAIATPIDADDISDQPLNGVPTPSTRNPAVGLLWGGSSSLSIFSPMSSVLSLLNLGMPGGSSTVRAPELNLQIEKSGRTTERTSGTINQINATFKVFIPDLNGTAVFKNQFATTPMSEGGDSGSVAVAV